MKPLVETPEDNERLRAIAQSWLGTPWVADGAIKGTGASCTMLPYAVLEEMGHGAPMPPARSGILKREILGAIVAWMEAHPAFYAEIDLSEIRSGDLPLFDLGIGHLTLALGGKQILHTWQTSGAHISHFSDGRLAARLRRAWRPFKR